MRFWLKTGFPAQTAARPARRPGPIPEASGTTPMGGQISRADSSAICPILKPSALSNELRAVNLFGKLTWMNVGWVFEDG